MFADFPLLQQETAALHQMEALVEGNAHKCCEMAV